MANVKKVNLKSKDFTEKFKQELKKKFPQVFNEDKVDCEKLKLVLGDEVDTGRERYGMNWPGKANAIRVAQEPSVATLKPDRDSSVDFDKTDNLFLEGDNLEILKLLQRSYFGKIKMIYIDPPYNTGKEFIYPDRYAEGLETYLQYTGQIDAEGKKFTTNVDTDGRFHSKWMNMMYSRLLLSRNLLSEDGTIFISIDDHEIDNLKKICYEIFGEENLKACLVWRKTHTQTNIGDFARVKEYILVFAKNILNNTFNKIPLTNLEEYRYEDEKGKFRRRNLIDSTRGRYEYSIKNPKGKSISGQWMLTMEELKELISNKEVYWAGDTPYGKNYLSEMQEKGQIANDFLGIEYGTNQRSTMHLDKLMDGRIFDFPKPIDLIKHFCVLSTDKDSIVLDFFAGSATTAHAVMALNAEDGGNRNFIMTQLQEPVDKNSLAGKVGYKNIAEIGKERIRRAGKKIIEDYKNKEGFDKDRFDKGFKVYKLEKSNFSAWIGKDNKDIQQKLLKHIDHISIDSTEEEVLYELLLKSGYELTAKVEEIKLDKNKVYSVAGAELVVCLDKDIDKGLIKKITELKPQKVICLNNSFKTDADLTNAAQVFKTKEIEFRTV